MFQDAGVCCRMAKAEDSEMDTFSSTPEAEESFSLPVHSLVAGLSKMYDKQSLWDVEIQVCWILYRCFVVVTAVFRTFSSSCLIDLREGILFWREMLLIMMKAFFTQFLLCDHLEQKVKQKMTWQKQETSVSNSVNISRQKRIPPS